MTVSEGGGGEEGGRGEGEWEKESTFSNSSVEMALATLDKLYLSRESCIELTVSAASTTYFRLHR